MPIYGVSKDLLFTGNDLQRPRMRVEQEKLERSFPSARFYANEAGRVVAVRGTLHQGTCEFRIAIPHNYPYEMPSIQLLRPTVDSQSPHQYQSGNICVMRSDQWSSNLSIAFLVGKTAIWIQKYYHWKRTGRWPSPWQGH